jgi:Predicted acyl-CoA transferases/carnitine dehydratase
MNTEKRKASELRPLTGIKVFDQAQGMAAALTAKLLAELGAKVFRPGLPEHEPFASVYPAHSAWRSREKRIPGDKNIELGEFDVCLLGGEDYPDLPRTEGAAELAFRHPQLIVLEIQGYPEGSPHFNRPATDLLIQARAGLVNELLLDKPMPFSFNPSAYGAALNGMCGILAALIDRETTGRGQAVFVSLFEGALLWMSGIWLDAATKTATTEFEIPKGVRPLIFQCKDKAYLHLAFGTPGAVEKTYEVLEIEEKAAPAGTGVNSGSSDPELFFGDCELLSRYIAQRSSDELIAAFTAAGVTAERIDPPGIAWSDPQVATNGLLIGSDTGESFLGNPLILHAGAARVEATSFARQDAPLGSARIVDFGTFVAGPYGSVILSDLGADVIKVEPIGGDPTRTVLRSHFSTNRGKRNIKLNLKTAEGQQIAQRLCKNADLVMNNFRPGVSSRLGLDAQWLQQIYPGLSVLECPAFGMDGPRAGEPGFDMTFQASCGHEYVAGGRGNPPFWNRTAMVDYCGGILGSVAALAALFHRSRTGTSVTASVPLFHGSLYLLSELIRKSDGRFFGAEPLNGTRTGRHPAEALYEVRGGWIAIAARDEAAARRLAKVLALEDVLPRSREEWSDAEQFEIGRALLGYTCEDAQILFEAHGIWIEPCVSNAEDLPLRDPQLRKNGTILITEHPEHGEVAQIGALVRFSRSKAKGKGHAPTPGEHTRQILAELGFDATAISGFYANRIVA